MWIGLTSQFMGQALRDRLDGGFRGIVCGVPSGCRELSSIRRWFTRWDAHGGLVTPCFEPVLITTLGFSWCNIDCAGRGQGHQGRCLPQRLGRQMQGPPPIELRERLSAPGSIVTEWDRFIVLPARTCAERSGPWITRKRFSIRSSCL